MKAIGLTGGIGSGKSLISRIFKILGVPVYEADTAAKTLMENDAEVRNALLSWFGDAVFQKGALDRRNLADRLFNDPAALKRVNDLVHPLIVKDFARWSNGHSEKPYVLHEAAILFETGLYRQLDATILVTAPEPLRIGRVMERDQATREQVEARMRNQWPDHQKETLADYLIRNDGTIAILPQVLDIHCKLTCISNG